MIKRILGAVIGAALWTAFIAWCGLGFDPLSWTPTDRALFGISTITFAVIGAVAAEWERMP